jgi:hypothetical protein
MAQSSSCPFCGCQDSWRHSLFECNMAKCVWVLQGEDLLEFINQHQHTDAYGWLHVWLKTDGIFPIPNRLFFHIWSDSVFLEKSGNGTEYGFRNRNGNGEDTFPPIFSEFHIWPEFYRIFSGILSDFSWPMNLSEGQSPIAHLNKP